MIYIMIYTAMTTLATPERRDVACSKQLRARLATTLSGAGVFRQALAFADRPTEHAPFRQSSEINISLIITKFAK